MPSYSNYQTYLKYKNCCRPIGDTGPPGPDGPTGPAGPTISGNKGDILYFSETDILDSTNTIFITNGNVTINNNLVVTGNLSMNNQFINDVSGIYFSDETYIGHGSSFDITTSETLDISAAGGISVTGNLTINNATTIDASTIIKANLSMDNQFINDVSGIYFSDTTYIGHGSSFDITTSETLDISAAGGVTVTGNLFIDSATTIRSTLDVSGNIAILNNNRLRFNNDNTYITSNIANDKLSLYGNSIFMEAGVNGDFVFTGNSTNVDLNFLTLSASGYTINYNDSDDKIKFNTNDFVIDVSNNYIGIQTDTPSATLEVNGNAIINGNLSMDGSFINDVSGIIFTQGNLLFSDFSSSIQQVQLPSSQGQPISLERKTLFYDDNFNNNIPGSSPFIIDFTNTNKVFNQLKLNVSGNLLQPSPDISGQYVEIYANFDVSSNTSPTKTFSLDISSVSGVSFFETIDVRSITKQGSFYLTFGPHIFIPAEWENTTGFNFVINNNGSNSFYINKYKLMFKSYFM